MQRSTMIRTPTPALQSTRILHCCEFKHKCRRHVVLPPAGEGFGGEGFGGVGGVGPCGDGLLDLAHAPVFGSQLPLPHWHCSHVPSFDHHPTEQLLQSSPAYPSEHWHCPGAAAAICDWDDRILSTWNVAADFLPLGQLQTP